MNSEVEYAIGRVMKVRRLAGKFRVIDSWLVGGHHRRRRRYKLAAVEGTGAMLNVTESFAEDMEPAPGEPANELTLVLDPDTGESAPVIRAATAAQEHASPDGQPVPAPAAEHAAPDAIRSRNASPGPGSGCMCGLSDFCAVHDAPPAASEVTLDAGSFGGELDPYSPGANRPDRLEEPGELQNPFKSVRKLPRRPSYSELRGIVYNARFKGLEDWSNREIEQLNDETPIAVAVTHETNGHAIWVITIDRSDIDIRRANLEIFYPNATGSSADAIEYAVLLALRQVPIRSDDLETLLLGLSF